MKHTEIGGKTLAGRQRREWRVDMHSNVNGRACTIVRFAKHDSSRMLIRWANSGKTRWVGLYEVAPEIS